MQILRRENRWGDTSFLLRGWSSFKKDGELSKWKPNLPAISAAIRFTIATKRLSSFETYNSDEESHEDRSEVGEESEKESDDEGEDNTT